jgi:hypothetical protein
VCMCVYERERFWWWFTSWTPHFYTNLLALLYVEESKRQALNSNEIFLAFVSRAQLGVPDITVNSSFGCIRKAAAAAAAIRVLGTSRLHPKGCHHTHSTWCSRGDWTVQHHDRRYPFSVTITSNHDKEAHQGSDSVFQRSYITCLGFRG